MNDLFNGAFLDLSDVSASDVLPEGDYEITLVNAEVKDTKDGTGQYIKAEFAVSGGSYDGWKLFNMFNIMNDNQKAVEIGLRQLKKFMIASGKDNFQLQSVNDLCGLTCLGTIGIRKSEGYDDQNIIKKFSKLPESSSNSFDSDSIPF